MSENVEQQRMVEGRSFEVCCFCIALNFSTDGFVFYLNTSVEITAENLTDCRRDVSWALPSA